jgi:mRNA guanylyltransferase
MKATGQQYDDRIVEVCWNKEMETWRFIRFRDDKLDGNHFSVVQNIIESIQDGVEVDEV